MLKSILIALAAIVSAPALAQPSPALSNVAKLRDIVVASDPAYAGGMKCDGATDDTAALNAAIAAAAATGAPTTVHLPRGTCKISSTINLCSTSYCVTLKGKGIGSKYQPTITSPTSLAWYGGASTMVQLGHQATVLKGGGLLDLELDGRAIATTGFSIKDHQHGKHDNLLITGTVTQALYMTNSTSAGTKEPTGWQRFGLLHIQLRGGATNSAHGIHLDGQGTNEEGVTLSVFDDVRIDHANGDGIRINRRGDGFTWNRVQIFRADVETGVGIHAYDTSDGQAIGMHYFGYLLSSSGIRIDEPNAAVGWTIGHMNTLDKNSGMVDFIYSEGAADVRVLSSTNDAGLGRSKILNHRKTLIDDPLFFRRYDAANTTLITSEKSYVTGGTGTPAITDAGQIAGAIQVQTSNVSGDTAYFAESAFASGVSRGLHPHMSAVWTPIDAASFQARVGFLGDVGNPPNNGVYIEADPATNANYRVITTNGGVSTATVTTVGVAVAKVQWRIEFDTDRAVFYYRTGGNDQWGVAAHHSTNIPGASTPLTPTFFVRTSAAAAKSIHVYDYKFGFSVEN